VEVHVCVPSADAGVALTRFTVRSHTDVSNTVTVSTTLGAAVVASTSYELRLHIASDIGV
jgi:hypothetical protein